MESLDIKRPLFYDVNGQINFIRGCSIDQIDQLKNLYFEFWNQIFSIEENLEIDFRIACEKNPKVFTIAKQILKICGIKPKLVDLPLLTALVHSYTDADGNPHRGYLAELSLYEQSQISRAIADKDSVSESLNWEEYKATIYALMVDISGDFEKAYSTYQNVPSELIEGYTLVKEKQAKKQKADPNNKLADIKQKKKKYMNLLEKQEKVESSPTKDDPNEIERKRQIGQRNLERLQARLS